MVAGDLYLAWVSLIYLTGVCIMIMYHNPIKK